MSKKINIGILLIFLSFLALGQKITIKGTVVDKESLPIPAATIMLKGTTQGTISELDGKFELEVDRIPATIIVSFVGYRSEEVQVTRSDVGTIVLEEDILTIDEYVVVGYATMKKSDLTGSVASIGEDEIRRANSVTVDLAMQGRISGVHIVSTSAEPGGDVNVTIRGNNSLSGNNDPLYVVDGIPLPPTGQASNSGGLASTNPLGFLSPNDIESIEVLKDASATAIYGSRGANGVIMITTKTNKTGRTKLDINVAQSLSEFYNKKAMATGGQYAQMRNEQTFFAWGGDTLTPPAYTYDGSSEWYPTPDNVGSADRKWLDEMTRLALRQDYQIGYSGTVNKTAFSISGSYLNEQGVIINTDYERFNLRTNIKSELSKRLNFSVSINLSVSGNNRAQSGPNGGLLSAIWSRPIYPRELDAINDAVFVDPEEGAAEYENPARSMIDKLDFTKNDSYNGDLTVNYLLSKNLLWVNRAGIRKKYSSVDQFWPLTTRRGYNSNGSAVKNSYNSWDMVYESFLNYSGNIINKNHDLNFTIGTAVEEGIEERFNFSITNFDLQGLGIDAIHMGNIPSDWSSFKAEPNGLYSFYIRSQYGYKNKYLINFTGRADGSRKFAENKKWAYFPSVGFAWRINQEPFMKHLEDVDNLKLRFSFGYVGSQAIRPYGSLTTFGASNYNFYDALALGISAEGLGNKDLCWEVTRQLDLGLDLGVFKDKLNITVDVYQKVTSGLLNSLSVAPSSGFTSQITNIGEIENKGYEVMIDAELLKKRNFIWRSSLNFSRNISKILDLGEKIEIYGSNIGGSSALNVPGHIFRVGDSFGMFYGWECVGLLQPEDFDENGLALVPIYPGSKEGMYKFVDQDGNGAIDDQDRVIIGNSNPDYIFGWSHSISFKNIEVSMLLQGSYGNQIFNAGATYYSSGKQIYNQTKEYFENRYIPNHKVGLENPFSQTNIHNDPNFPIFGTNYQIIAPASTFVEDGSYVRLKELTLKYNVPTKRIGNLNLVFSCINVITITNYTGFDPEVSSYGRDNLRPGVDYGGYPRPRIFSIGFQLSI